MRKGGRKSCFALTIKCKVEFVGFVHSMHKCHTGGWTSYDSCSSCFLQARWVNNNILIICFPPLNEKNHSHSYSAQITQWIAASLWHCKVIAIVFKAHSHGATVTTTATSVSSRLHWSLWKCSDGGTATMTLFRNGFKGYHWQWSHGKEFCSSRSCTVWMFL